MRWPQDVTNLIDKFEATPDDITVEDIKPLITYLSAQNVSVDLADLPYVKHDQEPRALRNLPAMMVVSGQKTSKPAVNRGILTIGIHGNEILAGALSVLETISAQKNGTLTGDVLIQIGNINAIHGYLAHYDANKPHTERSGWRASNGDAYGVQQVIDNDGTTRNIPNDFNRVPKDVMHLPRGQSENVDRTQEIIWAARAFEQGLINRNILAPREKGSIRFIMHPHTSRAPNGITNLSMPRHTFRRLKNGQYDQPFCLAPDYMRNFIHWPKSGINLPDTITQTILFENELTTRPLIFAAELGQHENIKTNKAPALHKTVQQFTRAVFHQAAMLECQTLSDQFNQLSQGRNLPIKQDYHIYKANPEYLSLASHNGAQALNDGDTIYPIKAISDSDRHNLSLQHLATHILLIDDNDNVEVIAQGDINQRQLDIEHANQAYYSLWPFEFEPIAKDQPIFLATGADNKAKYLSAKHDYYAFFSWARQTEYPLTLDIKSDLHKAISPAADKRETITISNAIKPYPRG